MKKSLFIIITAFLFAFSLAHAQVQDVDNGELDLYQIVNKILGEECNPFNSSSELDILPDNEDNKWEEIGDGVVQISVRYAGYDQELGIIDETDTYYTLVSISNNPGWQENLSITIPAQGNFVFVEKLSGSGSGEWYSDDRNSPRIDHFIAVDLTSDYNRCLGQSVDRAWIIAFEDLVDGGDWDYNDLVALVVDVDPIQTFAEEISISATSGAGAVSIKWTAVSEENVLGYNILRAKGILADYKKINSNLIYATGNIETTVSYTFTDTDVQNGSLYRYKLEEIESDGDTQIHGPAVAIPRLSYKLFK